MNNDQSNIPPAAERATVQVRWADGRTFEGPVGATLETFTQAAFPMRDDEPPVVAALVDGKLRELHVPVTRDVQATPITTAAEDGARIYRRGLSFLLVAAAAELFPAAEVKIDHATYSGGYFCQVSGREALSADELAQLAARMRAMAEANLPIAKEAMPLPRAVEMFRARGDMDKVKLLAQRRKDYLVVYRLGQLADYFHGYMLPATGYLRWFALHPEPPGFILQFPQRSAPTRLSPPEEHSRLVAAFREYGNWLGRLGVGDVGSLNEAIEAGRTRELILVSEALHEQRIAQIATWIAEGRGDIRLVLIAGPSSSGKTTFSKRLAVQLLANGLHPFALAMDEYFLDREQSPRDERGEYDFESIRAMNLERFNTDVLDLIAGKEVALPHYEFKSGRGGPGETVRLSADTVIVVEGIHGLNPELAPHIPAARVFRIYASALTQLNLDRHNRVSTTDTRLIRRIVRDASSRGYSARDTLKRWESVRRGETLHIFPFQENADVMFNSALVYELSALRPLVEPLLRQVEPDALEYVEANRLLAMLQWFAPISPEAIPSNSILREFVGGSILEQFRVWGMLNGGR